MMGIPICVPPISEQQIIAKFLDRETGRIDSLIARQESLISTLDVASAEEVATLVTEGVRWTGSFVESPVPWIPRVPEHWRFLRAKFLFQEVNRAPLDDDRVVTAFRDGQVTLRENRRSEGFTFAEKEVGYQHVCRGDLVIHTMDAFAGAVGVSESHGKCTGEYAVCVGRNSKVNHHYYAALLRLMAKRGYVLVLCPSVRERAPRFRYVRFREALLPVPPRAEQDMIVSKISEVFRRYNALKERAEEMLRVLREHRTALITAAVTGQIDVASRLALEAAE
jgi:type I restriction enzyme S subunit